MPDRIARAMVPGHRLLAVACVATDTARDARRRHDLADSSAAFLGKGLCAGLLLGALQKEETHHVNVQVGCDGPVGGLFVDALPTGQVRGYVREHSVSFPVAARFDDEVMLGREGYVAVLRERDGEFYRGVVDLEHRDLTLALEHYYRQSEQTATTLQLECLAEGEEVLGWVGGVLVQAMPDGDLEALEAVRQRLREGVVEQAVRAGRGSVHALFEALLGDAEIELLADQDAGFACPCSHERVTKALGTVEPDELTAMIEEDGKAEASCEFCGNQYLVTADELREIRSAALARRQA